MVPSSSNDAPSSPVSAAEVDAVALLSCTLIGPAQLSEYAAGVVDTGTAHLMVTAFLLLERVVILTRDEAIGQSEVSGDGVSAHEQAVALLRTERAEELRDLLRAHLAEVGPAAATQFLVELAQMVVDKAGAGFESELRTWAMRVATNPQTRAERPLFGH